MEKEEVNSRSSGEDESVTYGHETLVRDDREDEVGKAGIEEPHVGQEALAHE